MTEATPCFYCDHPLRCPVCGSTDVLHRGIRREWHRSYCNACRVEVRIE